MTPDFQFRDYASTFDVHIGASIPGYNELFERGLRLSRRFVQDGTNVVDLGCSSGRWLKAIRRTNQVARPSARYIGIDKEDAFGIGWGKRRAKNLEFKVCDLRSVDLTNVSFATSIFTVQFLPEHDKSNLLARIHQGMVKGGGFLIAEKVLAGSARQQDLLTFDYYAFKRRSFSGDEILDKERRLSGLMTSWSEEELRTELKQAGFRDLQIVWSNFPFVAILAIK